ncbi:hypothetical protein [Calothrix sp. NIES-2098]|uniref:hypothetical protein n=1 Tax=Calothrix sp. NIES-2098 TaxID=1954171 RepID=UPI000B62182A|nr:RP ribonucleotide reductase-like protein [Calothrix sp. NIES-2098]
MVRELETKYQSANFADIASAANPVLFRTYSRRSPAGLRSIRDQVCAGTLQSKKNTLALTKQGNEIKYINPIMQENRVNKAESFQPLLAVANIQPHNLLSLNVIGQAHENQNIPIIAHPTQGTTLPGALDLLPILSYGGVSVAVILAMNWFVQTHLKSITELVKVINKTKK